MTRKVLVVEDYKNLRTILVKRLLKKGYDVRGVIDGQEALDLIPSFRPEMVLLDIMMPNVDGFQVLKEIRNSEDSEIAKTPIIMLSNLGDDDDINRAMMLGADDYLIKSNISIDEIVEKMKIYMD